MIIHILGMGVGGKEMDGGGINSGSLMVIDLFEFPNFSS